ncbi:MAG: bis(5'-nucleosyl)-tetraphosphatase (symmetrical) YqeK [Clostridia bacterium]|nr:bis(5'-nucleosyl)-tetraphosphatase (symmetrical) YqeK [Clostridia bacterium]
MKITEEMLAALRKEIVPWLAPKRYLHTLAVEEEAAALGRIYLPAEENSLRAAALLHDITKRADTETQLQYCREFGIPVSAEDLRSPKVFHAKTAAGMVQKAFPAYADAQILSGIRWHTTGHQGMTMFEAIVYLADYIEATRTFPDCIELRKYFYDGLAGAQTEAEKMMVWDRTMVLSFDMTIRNLIEEKAPIDGDTIAARNMYVHRTKQPADS